MKYICFFLILLCLFCMTGCGAEGNASVAPHETVITQTEEHQSEPTSTFNSDKNPSHSLVENTVTSTKENANPTQPKGDTETYAEISDSSENTTLPAFLPSDGIELPNDIW